MELSTIVFHMDSQPNFGRLRERGWYHPLGLRNEPLLDSLIKDFGDYQLQIVHHHSDRSVGVWEYAEAFIHSKPEKPFMKKGEGGGMPLEAALDLVRRLYGEVG